jgi:TFIIF-interacting CTD phosphatase-like protein
MKLADIRLQLCEVYEKHAMSDSMVRRWMRHFNEGRENAHDDLQSGQLSVVNKDLVHAVEKKIQENRRFTILSLPLHFPQISRSLLLKIVSGKLQGSTVNACVYCDTLTKLFRAIQNK